MSGKAAAFRLEGYWGAKVTLIEEMNDGVKTQVDVGKVQFDAFHLRKEVFEQAAREGGMLAGLEWRDVRVSKER